jgi:signal transduction histidine kinase
VRGVEVTVTDTGIGLDAEHHELVFEKFYQVGSVAIHSSGKTTFKGGGPGLGLAIVRGVARAHGGKVWVESAGHDEVALPGSTFHLQLPINPPKTSE